MDPSPGRCRHPSAGSISRADDDAPGPMLDDRSRAVRSSMGGSCVRGAILRAPEPACRHNRAHSDARPSMGFFRKE
jgi:hypothetical protein